ncbi:Polyamine transporter PUT1 [Capsicum annuum]|nr:Polyamine transporter PUT1 [Capsicum annuum]
MGAEDDVECSSLHGGASTNAKNFTKVSLVPLTFLIFYGVSGGPFGVEDTVRAVGPLLTLVGFLIFPIIWSIPESLITAELCTMFPENGGYVVWVSSTLVLAEGYPRTIAILVFVVALTYLNYRGLTVVGWVATALAIFTLLPFIVMGLIALPKLEPSRWFVVGLENVQWGLFFNTLFWNLNYWDAVSTVAGEIENPGKTLPKALFYAVPLVVSGYFFPLLFGTGAVPLNRDLWTDGYFSEIAKIIGGVWLRLWVQGASAVSNMGSFLAEMSGDSFQLLGMAERGMLPDVFAKRSRYGTPPIGILFSASGVFLLSWLSFQEIVAAENFLYCFGMMLEFIAFVKLRIKYPAASRPYRIPLGTVGSILMCAPPTFFILVVMVLCSFKVMIVGFLAILVGLIMQPCLVYSDRKKWLSFSVSSELVDLQSGYHQVGEA